MKKILIILAVILTATILNAQSYHSGTITSDETWRTGSTHIINGNLTINQCSVGIQSGVTVIHQPGVVVTVTGTSGTPALFKIQDNVNYNFSGLWVWDAGLGMMVWNSGYIDITNFGKIEAGSSSPSGNNTVFKNYADYGTNGWKGIRVNNGAGNCYFYNCDFQNASKDVSGSYAFVGDDVGGALYIDNQSSSSTVAVEYCNFSDCRASAGGAIAIVSGDNDITIKNNNFIDNVAYDGGAIATHATTNARISLNKIADNEASNYGGGVYFEYNSNNLEFYNNVVYDNSGANGGGLYFDNSNVKVYNNTICHNTAGGYGSGCYYTSSTPVFRNSIIFFNSSDQVYPDPYYNQARYDFCDIEDLTSIWDDNISDDPEFADASNRDYRISKTNGSPCLDIGDQNVDHESYDIKGDDRVINAGNSLEIDIGAYEYENPLYQYKNSGEEIEEGETIFELYPIPSNEFLMISLYSEESQKLHISIFNMLGECILNDNAYLTENQNTISLNTESIKPGNYILLLKPEIGNNIKRKIVIE
jgi:hypothetical protein